MDVNAVTAIVKMLDALRLAILSTYSRADDTGDQKAKEAYQALSLVTGPLSVKVPQLHNQGSCGCPYPTIRIPGSPPPPPQDVDPGRGIRPH